MKFLAVVAAATLSSLLLVPTVSQAQSFGGEPLSIRISPRG